MHLVEKNSLKYERESYFQNVRCKEKSEENKNKRIEEHAFVEFHLFALNMEMAHFLAYIILTILTKLYRRTDCDVNLRLYFKFLRSHTRVTMECI